MDKLTVIDSVRYRCWQRGENYQEFVEQYVTETELRQQSKIDGLEGQFASALLNLMLALRRVELVANEADDGTWFSPLGG